jgi:hypothetical protein
MIPSFLLLLNLRREIPPFLPGLSHLPNMHLQQLKSPFRQQPLYLLYTQRRLHQYRRHLQDPMPVSNGS